MRKLPNGDAIHHVKSTVVSSTNEKDKRPTRERGELALKNRLKKSIV